MRRTILKAVPAAVLGAVAGPGLFSARPALAADPAWPSKPIRLVVPSVPGGGSDVAARIVADAVSKELGQPIVVDNKPGASGTLGITVGLQAPADGYTFMWAIPSSQVIPPKTIRYDPMNDLVPVSLVVSASFLLVVNPKSPYKTVQDLIDAAKAKPGTINYGSSGPGTFGHLLSASFGLASGTELTHIPYTSEAPVTVAIMGGELDMAFISTTVSLPQVKAGKLRALGVSSSTRMEGVPENIPLVSETVPGYDMVTFNHIVARAGTPQPLVDKMSQAIAKSLAEPAVRERLLGLGIVPGGSSPEELDRRVRSESAKLKDLIQRANIPLG